MTQEEKNLLLQDLCGRLPYGVYISPVDCGKAILIGIKDGNPLLWDTIHKKEYDKPWDIEYVKPYLRPMSSMTEEEKEEFHKLKQFSVTVVMPNGVSRIKPTYIVDLEDDGDGLNHLYDWLNARHFDYRGLIDKGLALPAPDNMYNMYNIGEN